MRPVGQPTEPAGSHPGGGRSGAAPRGWEPGAGKLARPDLRRGKRGDPSTYSTHRPVTLRKKVRDRLIEQAAARPDWVLGFQDETWWTRLAQPNVFAWAGEQPLRLLP